MQAVDSPLHVVYLLEAAPLFGGVKIVLHQANLLTDRGHRVEIVCPSPAPSWYQLRATWRQSESLEAHEIPEADVIVATFWTTLAPAVAARRGAVVHFCQGFEGHLTHNVAEHSAIEEAYRSPVPAFTVSPHLAELISEHFGRSARVVHQPLEPHWRPKRWRRRPGRPARILVTGPWEIYLKGVPVAAAAVLELRRRGVSCNLIRLSQWPLCVDEKNTLEPEEFHHHLDPLEVPALVRSCDLLLAPSWSQEGFGLPVLEAMASGTPAVASDIPSFRGFTDGAVPLVPYDDAGAFADAAAELLNSPSAWRRRRRRGIQVARRFDERLAGIEIEQVMRWVKAGAVSV